MRNGRSLVTLLIVGVLAAQANSIDPQTLIDDRVGTRKAAGIVVGTLDQTGKRIYSSGTTSAGGSEKPSGDTLFEIGSITKVFTSLLLADMIERGEVKAEDPVSRYLPDTAKVPSRNGKPITLLNLSMQNSGLPPLPSNLIPGENPYLEYGEEKLLAFLASYELLRDPGEKYEYSNLGVGLRGFALARRAHMSYAELVKERVFEPLHMIHSTASAAHSRKALAQGHDAALRPVKNSEFGVLAGAGAIRSTANEMLLFLAANLGLTDTPLKRAMERMRSVRSETGMPKVEVAMGWHIFSELPPDLYWHNGGTPGYRSFMGMDVAEKRAVVVLCNTAFDVDDIGKHVLNAKYPAALLEEAHEIQLDAASLSEYEGSYQLAPTFAIQFTARQGHLYAQATGQPELEVFASKKDEFFLKVVEARVSFTRNAEGKVNGMVLHQNGRDLPGARNP